MTRDRPDSGQTRIYEVRREKKTLAPFGQSRELVGRYLGQGDEDRSADSIIETLWEEAR